MALQYPLSVRFRIFAIAQQFALKDSQGKTALFVYQKALKLKEQIEIYSDESKQHLLFRIAADRVLDWSAAYAITDASGQRIGTVKRKGARSLWRATYDIDGHRQMQVTESNPWVAMVDFLVGQVPVLGWLTGFFLHPRYDLRIDGADHPPALSLVKRPSLLETGFDLELPSGQEVLPDDDERLAVLSLVLVVLMERYQS